MMIDKISTNTASHLLMKKIKNLFFLAMVIYMVLPTHVTSEVNLIIKINHHHHLLVVGNGK